MLFTPRNPAPDVPQARQSWSRADKLGVGTARSLSSSVWYTVANGIITEIYFPDVDSPQVKDFQLIFTDGATFFHDAQRDFTHKSEWIDFLPPKPAGGPAPTPVPTMGLRVTSTAIGQPYSYVQEVIGQPQSPCVLVRITLSGDPALLAKLHVYVLLAPHMGSDDQNNNAFVVSTANGKRLVANNGNYWLALGADCGFGMTSCGFVGFTDGYTDIVTNRRLPIWNYDAATGGCVALTAEVDRAGSNQFVMALGFCFDEATSVTQPAPNVALTNVTEALSYPFDDPAAPYAHLQEFQREWNAVIPSPFVPRPGVTGDNDRLFNISRNVLLSHEDKNASGALVASLSIPWGEVNFDLQCGYHLVWPRDMSQSTTALLASGDEDTALRGLMFLATSQSPDGSFQQKFFIDGQPWPGGSVQLDEYSFPIMLAYRLYKLGKLQGFEPKTMVLNAAGAIIIRAPFTLQERWEEVSGLSPSTLASNIAALVCAADLAANQWGDPVSAQFLLNYADFLESNLEKWCVTTQGTLVAGIATHYIRVMPPGNFPNLGHYPDDTTIQINIDNSRLSPFTANTIVDGGFLELVRYGIRSPRDPIIADSVRVIDRILQDSSMPQGPGYHRYNNDGYGQGPNGEPWEEVFPFKFGVGRPWPLLSGERGHYEVSLGNDATPYVRCLEQFAGLEKLIPEQVWNSPSQDNPTFTLGGPTGSARPLAWAHAEYIKLVRSVSDGQVFDRIDPVADRYLVPHAASTIEVFNLDYQPPRMKAGYRLRIPLGGNFRLRWTANNWSTFADTDATPILNLWYVDLPTLAAQAGGALEFNIFWKDSQTWRNGNNFHVALVP